MSVKTLAAPLWFVLALIPSVSTAEAQDLVTAGVLTCTTSETPPQAWADAELSCGFKGQSEAEILLSGTIARIGEADIPPGKRVLIWTVLSANPAIEPSHLVGSYAGVTGGETPGRLVGGKANGIFLDPANRTVAADEGPIPTVLELELKDVRA